MGFGWAQCDGHVRGTPSRELGHGENQQVIYFPPPKMQGADRVEDFHQISLSYSIYLIIAKVLANRLREVIDELVGPFQSAFIPARQLAKSAEVASKIVAARGRKGNKGFI